MTHAAASVLPCDGFEPLAVLETVAAERCTALYGVPTMFIAELEHPRFGEFDLSSLRTGIMAGSPCPIAVMRRVVAEMHMPELTICYGMTETSPVSFQTRAGRFARAARRHGRPRAPACAGEDRRRGWAGRAARRRRRTADPRLQRDARLLGRARAHARRARRGAAGCTPAISRSSTSDGYCNIVGRVKDMIIRGGENISPREIEDFLYRPSGGVSTWRWSASRTPSYGEAVCACVRLREGMSATEEEIRDFCRGADRALQGAALRPVHGRLPADRQR